MKKFETWHFPRADFDRLQGAGLPKGRSVRTIFLLFTKLMSEVFYVSEELRYLLVVLDKSQ